jgi:hypothetical protein
LAPLAVAIVVVIVLNAGSRSFRSSRPSARRRHLPSSCPPGRECAATGPPSPSMHASSCPATCCCSRRATASRPTRA